MNENVKNSDLKTDNSHKKRKIERNACYLHGEIIITKDNIIDCDIHDITINSVRIVIAEEKEIPDKFILHIPRRKVKEWVNVVRRSEKDFGVVFETFQF